MKRRSLWIATTAGARAYAPHEGTRYVDVAVVGAGIFGTTAAYLLKRAGLTVALLEMRQVGCGATGHTTAKLTVGQGLVYADLVATHGAAGARLYAESNQAAIEEVERIVHSESIECDWERTANYVYTEDPRRVVELERELGAASEAGIHGQLVTETELPFPVCGAIRVDHQAQFHPRRYLLALAGLVHGDGSAVYEHSRAIDVQAREHCVVTLPGGGRVECAHVVVASQLPFLDRGLFFAKAYPQKSYATASVSHVSAAPRGMYLSVDQPTRSVRSTPGADGARWLIVGGEGHKPGEDAGSERRYETLRTFARERFGAETEYEWSTHDFRPADGLPYIGRLRRGDARVLTATGFGKWA